MLIRSTSKYLSIVTVAVLAFCLPATAAVFYVDATAGDDTNSGLSEGEAIRSLSRASTLSLDPGDAILFRRGQTFDGVLDLSAAGSATSPVRVGGWGSGEAPELFELKLGGTNLLIENLTIDHRKAASDAIRIRSCLNCILRNLTVRYGRRDGIDADDASGLVIENVEIHHFLNGSFGSGDDAHGIVVTNSTNVVIRDADIHHVSGDSFQTDPNRVAGAISNDILIEDSVFWTGPLQRDFNSGWPAGASPGENAVDTKVLKTAYESQERVRLRLRNVTAYGWSRVPEISNRAAFNLKEKIDAVLDRVTVYDSEIAFRIRGALGNADTRITNTVIHSVEKAIRAEDGLANLTVYHTTFGGGIGQHLQTAGAAPATETWDWKNNAFLDTPPSIAADGTNIRARASDFADLTTHDYRLASSASLIDAGVNLPSIVHDRMGNIRTAPFDVGAFEYASSESNRTRPKPPVLSLAD